MTVHHVTGGCCDIRINLHCDRWLRDRVYFVDKWGCCGQRSRRTIRKLNIDRHISSFDWGVIGQECLNLDRLSGAFESIVCGVDLQHLGACNVIDWACCSCHCPCDWSADCKRTWENQSSNIEGLFGLVYWVLDCLVGWATNLAQTSVDARIFYS